MELVSFAKETLQNVAENAASYRIGQSALRQLDRLLWVVEKSAKWAVPPPLDQDERPQPELIRPLPWVFFLMMLITLRVVRESVSLANLVMGKPPLRSADVVMYIQSKRRYLRTLKYQGNRISRARTGPSPPTDSWYSSFRALFAVTMCFRRQEMSSNNNTDRANEDTERLVVKRSKRGRDNSSPVVSGGETTMERLIEKMMVDLDADSDDDSCFTLTNATSPKSERSDLTVDSDQETMLHNGTQPTLEDTKSHQQTPSKNLTKSCEEQIPTPLNDTKEAQKEVAKPKNDDNTQQKINGKENDGKAKDEATKQTDMQTKTMEEKISNSQKDTKDTQRETPKTKNDFKIPEKVSNHQNRAQEKVITDNNDVKNQNLPSKQQDDTTGVDTRPTKHKDTNTQEELTTVKNTKDDGQFVTTLNADTQMGQEMTKTQNETLKLRKELSKRSKKALSTPEFASEMHTEEAMGRNPESTELSTDLFTYPETTSLSPDEETLTFLLHETATSKIPRNSSGEQKIANGRTAKHTPNKKKGSHAHEKERRNAARSSSTNNM